MANDDHLFGAMTILKQCLGAKRGENVLVTYTPPSQYQDNLRYEVEGVRLFWLDVANLCREGELREECEILQQEKEAILRCLCQAATELGCSCVLCPVGLSHDLRGYYVENRSISSLRKFAKQCSILLDCTLVGIDKYIVRKRQFRTSPLKKEIKVAQTRGADLHNLDLESLAEGAMLEDYNEMAKRIEQVALSLKEVQSVHIEAEDTDLHLPIQQGGDTVLAKGLITGAGDWHFLPAGILSLCVDHTAVHGTIRLAGPMWGVDSLAYHPVILEAGTGGQLGIVKHKELFQNNSLKRLLETREGRFIGEVTLGFNRSALRDSDSPYEFYVADGNVTVALGANDHLGGQNPQLKERVRRVSNVHSHASISNATLTVRTDQGDLQLLSNGKWVT